MEQKATMLDYIASTPEYLRQNIGKSAELTAPLVEEYVSGGYQTLWIIASGSSSNASWCARPFLRRHLGCEVKVLAPFTFVHSENDFGPKDLVVLVSQSGYSLNVIQAADLIRFRGRRTVCLTGDLDSDLAKSCDVAADYGVGRETVAYVTRGVTTLTLFFMLFAIEAALRLEKKSAKEAEELKTQLLTAVQGNETAQKTWPAFFQAHYQSMTGMTNAYICGAGAGYGIALEGALKIGETVKLPTAAYEMEEYIHGPSLQLTPAYTVFLVDTGTGRERARQIFEATCIATPHTFLITTDPSAQGEGVFSVPCGVPEEMTPLCLLPVFQLTAHQVADDLSRWLKHPLQQKMEAAVSSKSANYVNSPMKRPS